MDKSHEKANTTRLKVAEIRAEKQRSKAAIMAALESVSTDPEATIDQKLEAARLAIELERKGYY